MKDKEQLRKEIDYIFQHNGSSQYAKNVQYSDSKYANQNTKDLILSLIEQREKEVIKDIFDFLDDHYWDTLDEDTLKTHLKAIKAKYGLEETHKQDCAKG